MTVTRTSFRRTGKDQILFPMEVDGSEAARATSSPMETVAKLKGKDPRIRVMKKRGMGRPRTPDITCGGERRRRWLAGKRGRGEGGTYVED